MRLSWFALAIVLTLRPAAAHAESLKWVQETIEFSGLKAYIKRPAGRVGRFPAVVVLGGLHTDARSLELIDPERPVLLAAFAYPYDGPKRFRFPRSLLEAPKIKQAALRTPPLISSLYRTLRARPDVDPERICALGASFGSPFVLHAAALDPGIRCLALVHGFADVPGTAAARMRQLWGRWLGPLARPVAWTLSKMLTFYFAPPDPEADARRLRPGQRVLMVEAKDDTIIPPASRDRLWRSLNASRARVRRVALDGDHLLGEKSEKAIQEIAALVAGWL